MNRYLISVKRRETNSIDLYSQLATIVEREFFQTISQVEKDLKLVDSARAAVLTLKADLYSTDLIQDCINYYGYLKQILQIFPDHFIDFTWYGALGFKRGPVCSKKSFTYERLNLIYQLGSLCCASALMESSYSDEGLRNMCIALQKAAGYFEFLDSEIRQYLEREKDQELKDIESNTIQFLKWLMLAQAQEVVWQKSILSCSLKDSAIARVAMEASTYYENAEKYGNLSEYIILNWLNHVAVRKYHLKASAYIRLSNVKQNTYEYGEQIAFLRIASANCELALKKTRYVVDSVIQDLKVLNDTVKSTLNNAERDNDLIYLKPVPDSATLRPLSGYSLVRAIEPEELLRINDRRIFAELIPFLVLQIVQAYRERQEEHVKKRFILPCEALNKMIHTYLNDRQLSSIIDTYFTPDNLPSSISQHYHDIMDKGGVKQMIDDIEVIAKLSREAELLYQACKLRLTMDSEEDSLLRQKLDLANWKRNSDNDLSDLHSKVEKMKEYLDQASAGDQIISEKFKSIRPLLELYCKGLSSLEQYVPTPEHIELDSARFDTFSKIKEKVYKLYQIERERTIFMRDLEAKSRSNTILPKIIDAFQKDRSDLLEHNEKVNEFTFNYTYEEHMKFLEEESQTFERFKSQQLELENEINELLLQVNLEHDARTNSSSLSRQKAIENLEETNIRYLELLSNITEALGFYESFLTRGNLLQQDCERYLSDRRIEARNIEHLFLS